MARVCKPDRLMAGALMLLLIVLDPLNASNLIHGVAAKTASASRSRPFVLLELAVGKCNQFGGACVGVEGCMHI